MIGVALKLDHMQIICTSLQTDNHASTSTSPLSFFTGQMPFPTPNQQRQSQGDHSFSTMIFHDFSMTKKMNFYA